MLFKSLIFEYEMFRVKFFWELTYYICCPFVTDDLLVSWSGAPSLKNGEPPLNSDVKAPFADAPVLLPEDPNGFVPLVS